ncbi:MAG: hypothetical protein DDT21_01886 [Syntrophomonadaceae bacterium]|nr:hypothetical protein [Bacillota bacterium]
MIERTFHSIAKFFPLMTGAEFDAFRDDIAENGLREAIWLHPDGSIVDGRNRYRACVELGIEPEYRTWDGQGSLVTFVVSLNLHRRHLDTGQRGMVAARLAQLQQGANQHRSIDLPTQSEAAELLNVSVPSVKRAKEVIEQGTPELVQIVEKGDVSVSAAASVATLPFIEQREIVARGQKEILAAAKQIREEKETKNRAVRVERINTIARGNKPLETAGRLFPVLLVDPPWRYEHSISSSRKIENHYPTMLLEEICALPVSSIAAPDSILFLWTTSPKLEESLQVINAWGFTYRTCLVWVKDRIGMGYYARQSHELLLIARRGEMVTPEVSNRFLSVIEAEPGKHSEKPQIVYEMIEKMYPEFDKVELFAREKREGWFSWGNQV